MTGICAGQQWLAGEVDLCSAALPFQARGQNHSHESSSPQGFVGGSRDGPFDEVICGVTGSKGGSSSTSPFAKALLLLLAAKAFTSYTNRPKALQAPRAPDKTDTSSATHPPSDISGRAEFERARCTTQTPHEWGPRPPGHILGWSWSKRARSARSAAEGAWAL